MVNTAAYALKYFGITNSHFWSINTEEVDLKQYRDWTDCRGYEVVLTHPEFGVRGVIFSAQMVPLSFWVLHDGIQMKDLVPLI